MTAIQVAIWAPVVMDVGFHWQALIQEPAALLARLPGRRHWWQLLAMVLHHATDSHNRDIGSEGISVLDDGGIKGRNKVALLVRIQPVIKTERVQTPTGSPQHVNTCAKHVPSPSGALLEGYLKSRTSKHLNLC